VKIAVSIAAIGWTILAVAYAIAPPAESHGNIIWPSPQIFGSLHLGATNTGGTPQLAWIEYDPQMLSITMQSPATTVAFQPKKRFTIFRSRNASVAYKATVMRIIAVMPMP
jgi:hypothetical protein